VRRPLTRDDLVAMIERVAAAMLPGVPLQLEPAVHPYTLDGLEVHGNVQGRWVEILECGRAHPDILAAAGLADCTGLAMGIGLDRMLMLRKGVEDIRALRSATRAFRCRCSTWSRTVRCRRSRRSIAICRWR
jgi:phenylalanyl-tRNA synthetase alpha chain